MHHVSMLSYLARFSSPLISYRPRVGKVLDVVHSMRRGNIRDMRYYAMHNVGTNRILFLAPDRWIKYWAWSSPFQEDHDMSIGKERHTLERVTAKSRLISLGINGQASPVESNKTSNETTAILRCQTWILVWHDLETQLVYIMSMMYAYLHNDVLGQGIARSISNPHDGVEYKSPLYHRRHPPQTRRIHYQWTHPGSR